MSGASLARPLTTGSAAVGARVMVVDDSVVARGLTVRWLSEEPDLEVVASCRSGRDAVARVAETRPDVIVLDVEMPEMDGVEALPLLLKACPHAAVLMASSHTTGGAALTMRCLDLGATDFLAKPSGAVTSADYRQELIGRVRALRNVSRRRSGAAGAAVAAATLNRRPAVHGPMNALVIGSSTGGPQALREVLKSAGPAIAHLPTLIVQHMPAGFTEALAEQLSTSAGLVAREAQDGEPIVPGRVYVAPGGLHLTISKVLGRAVARLDDGPRINFCKPSVDRLFHSAAAVYGSGLVAVVLTGMGVDGASAAPVIAGAGGRVIAQDEATSVVWGMPGAAVATGACSAVLPLKEIGPCVARVARGERM